jgi:hypothetical protein
MENLQRVADEVRLSIDATSPSTGATSNRAGASSDTAVGASIDATIPGAPFVCATTSARQGQRLER